MCEFRRGSSLESGWAVGRVGSWPRSPGRYAGSGHGPHSCVQCPCMAGPVGLLSNAAPRPVTSAGPSLGWHLSSQEQGSPLHPRGPFSFSRESCSRAEAALAPGEGAHVPCRSQGQAGLREGGGRCLGLGVVSALSGRGLTACVPAGAVPLHAPHSLAQYAASSKL